MSFDPEIPGYAFFLGKFNEISNCQSTEYKIRNLSLNGNETGNKKGIIVKESKTIKIKAVTTVE